MVILTTVLGLLSAVLWMASSVAWAFAANVDAPLARAKHGAPNSIVVTSGPHAELSIGGVKVANFEELDRYNRRVAGHNKVAAWISAAAAVASGAAVVVNLFVE